MKTAAFLFVSFIFYTGSVCFAQKEKPEVAVSPVASMGKISEFQQSIVHNHLQSVLSKYYQLVSKQRFGEAQ
ncbi:MAG: hypothetical protein HQM14_19175, partial [SAR324 cluster bacterium]|nr:hypothetical protein [SAR324 cluster bacterium]